MPADRLEMAITGKSLDWRTSSPSTLRTMSPACKPAFNAGLLGNTRAINAPEALSKPNDLARL